MLLFIFHINNAIYICIMYIHTKIHKQVHSVNVESLRAKICYTALIQKSEIAI